MSKRETKDSGSFNMATVALLAIVICAVAVLLMPAHAGTEVSAAPDATYATGDYLPAQVPNQAKEVEPQPEMYY
jgi:hypothetical protein